MERNYSNEDLQAIKSDQTVETLFGTEVIVRHIPHEPERGMIDPRLKATMDAKMTSEGVIAPPPFAPAMFALPTEEILKFIQKMYEDSAKKKGRRGVKTPSRRKR